MKIIDIPGGQGSAEWHQHRRDHWNASDAPAMMGCSPHKTRSELMRELHTGITCEPDDATQQRFSDGHRAEALARPVAEALLDEALYPLVKANGRLSASLDGHTLMGDVDWEHKTLNEELRSAIPVLTDPPICSAHIGKALPLQYRVQMAHQQHCSGAQRTLFTASKWDSEGKLIEARHCWYERDEDLIARVLAGWAQFEADLADYQPPEAAPVITAAPQEHLPAVSVQLSGALAVVSNLEPFGVALRAFVERIPKKPSTDQEFADTEAACKRLKEAEERLQAAEDSALAGMADVEAMRRMVADFRDLARTTRLASEKLVKQRKDQIREEEVVRGHGAMTEHIAALNRRLGGVYITGLTAGNFGAAIKGLKTLDSVRNAIDTELARAKIEASALADKIDANLRAMSTGCEGLCGLFPDMKTLALKEPDDLAAVIAQRVAQRKQADEAARERIRAEEAARVEREAAAQAERNRTTEARDSQQVLKAEPATADATDRDAPAIASPRVGAMGAGQAADAAPAGDTRPPIKLGDICERLGFTITAAFVTDTLGIKPVGTDKRAVLFAAADYARICDALCRHIITKRSEHA